MIPSPSQLQLVEDLEHARHEFTATYAQWGSALAVKAAIDFMTREGVSPSLMVPLLAVVADLSDRHNESNLKPHLEALQWARAAGAIDVLMSLGLTLPQAASKVSRAAHNAFKAGEIIEFRKNIRKRRAREDAVDKYFEMARLFQQHPPEGKERAVLDMIAELCAPPKKG